MYWRQQPPRRWETQICFRKSQTRLMKQTIWLANHAAWLRTVPVLVCPPFERAPLHAQHGACVSVLAEACEWQAVSERDVIIWLMSVRVVSRGRVTSLAASWHSADRKHYFMISPRGESTLVTGHPISFWDYSTMSHTKKVQDIYHHKMEETHLWTVCPGLFLFFKLIGLLCSGGLGEGSVPPPSCPYPLTSSV